MSADRCQLCGGAVRVMGHTTHYYEPVVPHLTAEDVLRLWSEDESAMNAHEVAAFYNAILDAKARKP